MPRRFTPTWWKHYVCFSLFRGKVQFRNAKNGIIRCRQCRRFKDACGFENDPIEALNPVCDSCLRKNAKAA